MKSITKNGTRLGATVILFTASMAAAPAFAQDRELDPAAVAEAVRYSLPMAFEGFVTSCFDILDEDGFTSANAPRLREKFAEGAEASWPGAKLLMMQMAEERTGESAGLLDLLSDDEMRAIVDEVVETKVAEGIKPETCEHIERTLEILDPLPADNMAGLVGLLVELGLDDEDEEEATLYIPPAANTPTPEMTESRRRKLREQEDEQ